MQRPKNKRQNLKFSQFFNKDDKENDNINCFKAKQNYYVLQSFCQAPLSNKRCTMDKLYNKGRFLL